MMQRGAWVGAVWALLIAWGDATEVGNRLAYLDDPVNPYWVNVASPRLVTPQWVGEDQVEAVIVLAIDDLGDPAKYEAFLRPILDRLKQIDGRSAMSIMSNKPDLQAPQIGPWLADGVSLEAHTVDHPCPLLQKGNFAAAKTTYDMCIDGLSATAAQQPVAFRTPCCDSMNSVSPRFFTEIFNSTTPQGRFLEIDSSVFQVFTADDPELPREWVVDEDGQGKFAKYIPTDRLMVNYVENYPYPYVIGRTCWEFPCLMPSDWDAQHRNGKCSPLTVRDLQVAIDAVVRKQGVFSLCFHPHGWLSNAQVVELIDYAQQQHAGKVRFLSFRDVAERLTTNLLAGHALRDAAGQDNGVRTLDVNNDGYMDVVVANASCRLTRCWDPASRQWREASFPVRLTEGDTSTTARDRGVRFGILRPDGRASVLVHAEERGVWHFDGTDWVPDEAGGEALVPPIRTAVAGRDQGVRLRDLDRDGCCELIVAHPEEQAVFRLSAATWERLPVSLPAGLVLVDREGRDAGLRWVDLNGDGYDDLLFSHPERTAAYLFTSLDQGWSHGGLDGPRTAASSLPPIVRADGTNNGVWFKDQHMWVQNEDTGGATPHHVLSYHFERDILAASP